MKLFLENNFFFIGFIIIFNLKKCYLGNNLIIYCNSYEDMKELKSFFMKL